MSILMIDNDNDLFLVDGGSSTLLKINDVEDRIAHAEECVPIGTKIKTEYLKNLREVEIGSVLIKEVDYVTGYPKVMKKTKRNMRFDDEILAYVTDSGHGIVIKPKYLAGSDIIIKNIDEWSNILNDDFVGFGDEL